MPDICSYYEEPQITSHLSSPPIIDVAIQAQNSKLSNIVFARLNWLNLKLRVKKKVRMGEGNEEDMSDVGIGGETDIV